MVVIYYHFHHQNYQKVVSPYLPFWPLIVVVILAL